MLWSELRLILKTSSVTPDFFYVFYRILSFSTCSQSFKIIYSWEVLGANVFKYLLFFLSFSASVEVFLRFLQKEYQWSTNSVKAISSQLAKDDITSVRLLAMCWKEAQERFPIGMRKMIDKELRKRDMI